MKVKTDWRHQDDVRRVSAYAESAHIDPEIDCRVSANVGDIMAAAIAAAGQNVLLLGGRRACETDYLAACGATFPEVPLAELVEFNRRTLREDMDEEQEMRRYAAIASFFHPNEGARCRSH